MKLFTHTLFFFFLLTIFCFAQWVEVGLNDESIKDIAVKNSNMFAITVDEGKLFRSTDNGANWVKIINGIAVDVTISSQGNVFMLKDTMVNPPYGHYNELHYSTDYGNTWIWIDLFEQLGYYNDILDIIVSPLGTLFCGIIVCSPWDCQTQFAKSTNEGLTWTTPGLSVAGGLLFDFNSQSAITTGFGYCGYQTMYLSSDYGNTWDSIGHPNCSFITLGIFSNGNIIAGGNPGYFGQYITQISTDGGNTWKQIAILNSIVGVSWSHNVLEGMIISNDSSGVYLFSDEGDSLGSWNEGLTNLNVQALTLDNNGYVYAGTGNGVWRRPLSEVTLVEENQIEILSGYNLSQNYPNPFNPSTKIIYSVPQTSQVQIKVFDVLGNEIETLVNEEKPAGSYELTWNAANLPSRQGSALTSGVYFYQLKAGGYIEIKKMILIK